ncbi:zonular occludens toxin domain-containing protein [Lysobacter yananisis]|uniref:Zonular occludens toxin domain-containing protein n=1 Tax=Lysobacter yananisis TaxID=1003114 RepID=A0ABY9P5E8_9GAMM|nr:zonular occludens toxin domain-containing protein [Lysobacter yananisis]WMT02085.1 zonular occludens toxin domain-containing protein [Lysobacter yananisis]
MIYQWTGQPGHGKTLHALDQAIDFRDAGRLVYVCNVRNFDHGKARMLPLEPAQFKDWMNATPEGCVILVDECYEHDMLTKRSPGSKVPEHVKELAKHRHTGRDFIFVCQSPSKQMDEFVHDNIERHTHVRRRFGLPFAHLRIFDRYERNPEKAHPLILKRVKLPRRPMGLYESTVLDTTERKVPWYYPAAAILAVVILVGGYMTASRVNSRFSPDAKPVAAGASGRGNGASATVPRTLSEERKGSAPVYDTAGDYAKAHLPRFATMPWTAPVYDHRSITADPQLLCMSSGAGVDADGVEHPESCRCVTEQNTVYAISQGECMRIARDGPVYNPYKQRATANSDEKRNSSDAGKPSEPDAIPAATAVMSAPQVAGYGAIGVGSPVNK